MSTEKQVNKFKFGAYLKGLRLSINGMTLRKAAFKSGISSGYLSQVENGIRDIPSPDILKKLAPVYKVSYEELMMDAGYLKRPEEATDDPILKEKLIRYMEYYKVAENAANANIPADVLQKMIDIFEQNKKTQG